MAKSSETFNKKEKEKKRLKKQQEKKEKSEARKANSDKGKGLEDMMAYVDEHGNISATPPSSSRQKPVLAEDIQVSTPKFVPEPEGQLKSGIISFFNAGKGYGFIRDNQTRENVFFHVNNLSFVAKENDKVSFATEQGPKGLQAVKVNEIK